MLGVPASGALLGADACSEPPLPLAAAIARAPCCDRPRAHLAGIRDEADGEVDDDGVEEAVGQDPGKLGRKLGEPVGHHAVGAGSVLTVVNGPGGDAMRFMHCQLR
jgi:hypothetical protein